MADNDSVGGSGPGKAKGRDRSLFGPGPANEESRGLWTQFSGMPNQPGSPTSLHEWLQSVDDADLPVSNSPGSVDFQGYNSAAKSRSRNSSLNSFSAADFLGARVEPDPVRNMTQPPPRSDVGHHFNFGSPPEFGPSDFAAVHPTQFSHSSHSSLGHFPPPREMSGLPPADFSHPPPDFNYGAQPDFSRPPPSFLPDVPLLQHTADHRQRIDFADFFPTHSQHSYPQQDVGLTREPQHQPGPSDFDMRNHQSGPITMPSHVDVMLPPPNLSPYPMGGGNSMLFQDPVDFDQQEQNGTHSYETAAPTQKKVIRQNSEPMYGGAAEEGKAMYVEALRRLNSFGPSGPSYEPFGSAQQQEDAVETASTQSDECPPSKPATIKKAEPPKPSYSDVAKAAKTKSKHAKPEGSASEKAEAENLPKPGSDSSSTQSHRQKPARRQFSHTRIVNQRSKGNASDNNPGNYVKPNSRYGLDQFEDSPGFVRAEQRSSSVESLNSQLRQDASRRGSNTSLSSGGGAVVDDGHGKSGTSCATNTADSRHSRYREKSSNLNSRDSIHNRVVYNNTGVHPECASATNGTGQQSQKAGVSSASSASATHKAKADKVFFDPKRIFQSRGGGSGKGSESTRASEAAVRSDKDVRAKEETVLNNGKPNNNTCKAAAASHRKTDYINNDLREGGGCASAGSTGSVGGGGSSGGGSGGGGASASSGKRTNQTAAFGRHGSKKHSSKESASQNGSNTERSKGGESRGRRQDGEPNDDNSFIHNIDWVLVDEWMKYISDCSMTFARNSFSAILTLLVYLLGVVMYLAMGAIHLIALAVGKLWSMVKSRLFGYQPFGSWSRSASSAENARKRFGVDENITLPSTGEEAMKRLLGCKGKDPYSILGLRADASDEDIKRYYRKQAVLVHPDKNQEPGAEEAFKILGHAFEMIGEPAKRKEYDSLIFEAHEAETAMREFSDLLTKLQEKVQEAANMMRCDNCGGKHRRIPVDRPWYSARFCDRCNIHHSAKEGDVWAESSMLGFLWHYYACMDNNIYDITDWVSCQRENFRHMKPNAHPVFYRIQTDGNRRHRQGQSGEPDLEDFINRFFNKSSMYPDGASPSGWQYPSQQSGSGASQSSWNAGASSNSSSSNSKRSKRRKKRN